MILYYLILDLIYTQAYVNQQEELYRTAVKTKKHKSILFIVSIKINFIISFFFKNINNIQQMLVLLIILCVCLDLKLIKKKTLIIIFFIDSGGCQPCTTVQMQTDYAYQQQGMNLFFFITIYFYYLNFCFSS